MKVKQVITIVLSAMLGIEVMAADSKPALVYSRPSAKWMGALPLGNGRLGAMVYGGTDVETIALNEVTMWSGQPDPEANNLCGPDRLREMREAFLSGDYKRGNDLGWQYLCGHGKSFGTNLPFGDLLIGTVGGDVSGYRRELALDEAVARVGFVCGGTRFSREYFASNPAQALVVRYTADKAHALSATVSMRMLRHSEVTARANQIDITGDARFDKNGEGGVRFRGIVRVMADGGSVRAVGDRLVVDRADAMTIIVDIRTDFQNLNYRSQCLNTVETAASRPYDELKREHVADFKAIFDRMDIDLGRPTTDANTTDEMFAEAHKGLSNPAFDALFFKYGRYMQISSSRENSPLPSNLQGIWNDNLACNMPWTCDYHLDINIQQNYWSANIANMAETNAPLFTYIGLLAKYGSVTARKMYGCGGWVAHTINNVWGDTAPGSACSWAMNVTAGAWMATHLWTHYEYTLDKDYLREVGYPLLKETAQFFVDYMVEDPKTGYLLSGPSISPENGFRGADGRGYSLSMMPTIDRAVIYDIYNACIQSAKILGIDDDFSRRLQRDIKKLPPLRLLDNGELAEWYLDVVRDDPSHRHASHLLALYPFGQISPFKTPGLAEGCRLFLENQTSHANWEDTEWTRGNNINFYARLLDGEKAYESLKGLYTGFMRENLMTVSPAGIAGAESDIFSFDATEAAVAGVCEMLLQSYDGMLNFLPALPKAWKNGSIKGVCARGGIEADFAWKNRKVVSATLRSRVDQTVSVRVNGKEKTVELKAGVPFTLL
ncbi:glycoside hydrolase family 95 protein [Marseilla massiliensis]|uniref:Glycoside hydrolase N-terminal domain-containing protein n=1 Tax=Marseilla massiliensis TaxID=1841864 RepID=A0A938WMR1_9BACT|nr:glycoside hydrolase family 95 protein [Marseilla massiliensis]MBM6660948.1 glycoside hydrolase N-terminal domain-containing protein [Marseilla massiliensis]